MKITEMLGAFLSANGQHEAAAKAYGATTRDEWYPLIDTAIRTTPDYERTNVAWKLKLEADRPENGGAGEAADFELRRETKPTVYADMSTVWYKAYKLTETPNQFTATYTGLASSDITQLMRRIVATFVVREFKAK